MNLLELKIARLEREVIKRKGDAYRQAMEDAHHEVLSANILKIRVEIAQRNEQPTGPVQELTQEQRDRAAKWTREEDARYREIGREAYLAELPTAYTCGKCGATVEINVEKMMRPEARLPKCACSANALEARDVH